MISSRVELFFLPTDAVASDKVQRIGHFEFQHNMGYENSLQPVRELKTVHFGATTRQLNVNIYSPYSNKDNIFH